MSEIQELLESIMSTHGQHEQELEEMSNIHNRMTFSFRKLGTDPQPRALKDTKNSLRSSTPDNNRFPTPKRPNSLQHATFLSPLNLTKSKDHFNSKPLW